MTCIQDYIEDQYQLIADVEYNIKYLDMKLIAFARLAEFLRETLHLNSKEEISHADIGCNIGALVKVFTDASYKSVGYDINPVAIEKARSLFPEIEIIAKKAGTDNRQFDIVTMIDVLEHIKTPFEFFESILPCLKDGAYMFIVVPRVDRDLWKYLAEDSAEQLKPPGLFNADQIAL
jgi:2-polyprenyl-3-methyl-5-hydroxy-6-metoxy-1,4-benzoquinol methylase